MTRDPSQDTLFYMIKTVVRHSAVYGFFDMLGKTTALILVPLYTRVMSPADYGTLEIFVVSQALLLTLLVLGFNSALVRFYTTAPEGEERRRYFRTAFTGVVLAAGGVGLLLMLAAPGLSLLFFGDAARAMHWRLLLATVVVDAAGAMFLALFRSQERPFRYSLVNLSRFLLILVLNVVLVGFLGLGVKGALIGNFTGAALGGGLGLVLAGREFGFGFSRGHLRRLAAYGMPLVVNGIAVSLMMGSAAYFLKAYGTLTDVGIYRVGQKVGMIMSVIINAFTVAWFPVQFRISREENAPAIYGRVLTYYLVVTLSVLVLVSSYSHEIVRLIAPAEFGPAAGIVLIILASYVLQGVYYLATTGVTLTDRTGWVSLVAAVSALVNLALNFLLVPAHGMMGAAWATLLSFLLLAILMKVLADRHYRIPVEGRRIGVLIGGSAAVVLVNQRWVGHDSAGDAMVKVLPLAAVPALLVLLGFFSSEERGRILRAIRRRG